MKKIAIFLMMICLIITGLSAQQAGLYAKAPPITASDTPLANIAANNVNAAFAHINIEGHGRPRAGSYTLVISQNVNASNMRVANPGFHITVIGLGEERTISYDGRDDRPLVSVENSASSLTLGNNITLKGKDNLRNPAERPLASVFRGTFRMLPGSKITGHVTSNKDVIPAVLITNSASSFVMEGGEITGNGTMFRGEDATAGVIIRNNASFMIVGGKIEGNFIYTNTSKRLGAQVDLTISSAEGEITISGGTIGTTSDTRERDVARAARNTADRERAQRERAEKERAEQAAAEAMAPFWQTLRGTVWISGARRIEFANSDTPGVTIVVAQNTSPITDRITSITANSVGSRYFSFSYSISGNTLTVSNYYQLMQTTSMNGAFTKR
ncbi:MAG: hypothetical protein FWD26_02350 [Treponema sp.]|nr:hypothetical protein [Treponema sp.]